jgi:AAA+ superfamily predicted ATPase
MSLSARGMGRVGEMTKLISSAFDFVLDDAEKKAVPKGKPTAAVILLIDEADALAQSRELAQMHHEDRAGVNAFIRGIDRVAQSRAPMVVIMCTNRLSAIDPAIRRRAAEVLEFSRPNMEQRKAALQPLAEAGFSEEQIGKIAEAAGRDEYGFTYSDIVQRLMPAIVLDAYPENPISFERALSIVREIKPTPPFQERQAE